MFDYQLLLAKAAEAREYAYAPYSHFTVGACLLAQNGKLFTGCNVENASSGACVCAERTALVKAVSEGVHAFSAIAIVGGESGEEGAFCPPCGICRQVLSEFCDGDFPVVLRKEGEVVTIPLRDLLPYAFKLEN